MEDLGALKPLVTVASQIVSAGIVLVAVISDKVIWAPPSAGLRNYTRILGAIAGIGMTILYVLSKSDVNSAIFTIIAGIAAVIGLIGASLYLKLRSELCFTCREDPTLYVAGRRLKTQAQRVLNGEINLPPPYGPLLQAPASQQEYFCNSGKDPNFVWEEGSQAVAVRSLFTAYGLVMIPLTLALASASIALNQVDIQITETPAETRIDMSTDILFDFNKADIKSSAAPTLEKVATTLQKRGVRAARIEGHTDAQGTPAYNKILSERRAAAVYNWLVNIAGLNDIRFTVLGFGATKPVAPNIKADGSDDPIGRQKNRRVEIAFDKR